MRIADTLRYLFFLVVVRPLVLVVLGLNVRHRERLPTRGPAIVVANHNSHLDTLVLMTLFRQRLLPSLRPVAAVDYFMSRPWLRWFVTQIIGIIPLDRRFRASAGDPLRGCDEALEQGGILILFPEGSRGEPEDLAGLKTGIAHLAQRRPEVPVVPVFLHGLGKALPKGETLLVPFFCDVFVGGALFWTGDRGSFMARLDERMRTLAAEGRFPTWESGT
ncbi:MAG: lysophospholipid acyltransferase family protein [Alphaproteobacteria bacterium]